MAPKCSASRSEIPCSATAISTSWTLASLKCLQNLQMYKRNITHAPICGILITVLTNVFIYTNLHSLLSMLNWLSPLGSTSRRTEDNIGSDSGSPNDRKAAVKSCVWKNRFMIYFISKVSRIEVIRITSSLNMPLRIPSRTKRSDNN